MLLSPRLTTNEPVCVVERNSHFQGAAHISGYAFCSASPVVGLSIHLVDGRRFSIPQIALPSADLSRLYGRQAAACRFDGRLFTGLEAQQMLDTKIEILLENGATHLRPLAGVDPNDPVALLTQRFLGELHGRPPGHLLEIGSRNRTGGLWRRHLPETWQYTGFDILEGENVDIVGDAHEASSFLPRSGFDAAMSFVVFEHLLMPWKAAIEINRVLRIGAIGLIVAPQTWPLHEEPCDYFRFSRHSWKALFNPLTGFEILDAVDGTRGYIVARVTNAGTQFGEATGALMSAVLFRKISETTVDWAVPMKAIADDLYPF